MQHNQRFGSKLLLTIAWCVVFPGFAKPQTLTSSDVIAPIGASYHLHDIVDLFPWDTLQGPGVTWEYDWTSVDAGAATLIDHINVSQSPFAGSYPDADIAVRSTSGANSDYIIDRFFSYQGGEVEELGSVGPVLSYVYDDPELVFILPQSLGDTTWRSYCFGSDGLGVQYHFCGANYTTFDAMGTLELPYGTFTDVKHVTQWHSLFETGGASPDSSYNVRQLWFVPGVPFPVLEVNVFLTADGSQYPGGRLMDQASVNAVIEHASFDQQLQPNPTDGNFTVQRTSTLEATIDIIAPDGKLVQSAHFANGSTTMQLSLAGLPDGVYLVRITDAVSRTAQRVMKN